MTRRTLSTPLPWLGGLLGLYLLFPLAALLVRLATSNSRGFSTPGLWGSVYVSVVTATLSAAVIALFGIPLAYWLARSRGRLATAVGVAVQLPLALPPLMGGILLVSLVGPYTTLGRAFGRHLTDSMVGVVLAQTFVAAPFLIISARSAFASVDQTLDDHAASLGHREISRFWRVSLPIAGPGIRAGLLLSWLRAFGEYGATVVLAYHPYTLPVYTYVQFASTGVPTTEAPTALALLVAVTVATVWRVPRTPRWQDRPVAPAPATPPHSIPAPVKCDLDVRLGSFHLALAYSARTPRLAVLGPSGSGKSVTLRAMAGLFGPQAGNISYGTIDVDRLPVESRRIGYVPQGYGLFPHLTVWRQVCFGVGADEAVAAYWLARLHLSGLENRLPSELSGGQRQRVALVQALARSPDLLLLDEPFSALDAPVRYELRTEMRSFQRDNELSTVLVTHDPEEAAFLADELIVLTAGRVLQAGPREQIFARPASPEVARLIGYRNIHDGVVTDDGVLLVGTQRLTAPVDLELRDEQVVWSIRPEHVHVGRQGAYEAVILDTADLGAVTLVLVQLGNVQLEARSISREPLTTGSSCRVDLPPDAIRVWPAAVTQEPEGPRTRTDVRGGS